jgi:hypothetical protein
MAVAAASSAMAAATALLATLAVVTYWTLKRGK